MTYGRFFAGTYRWHRAAIVSTWSLLQMPNHVFVSNETLSHPATMVTTEEQNARLRHCRKALNADWFCKTPFSGIILSPSERRIINGINRSSWMPYRNQSMDSARAHSSLLLALQVASVSQDRFLQHCAMLLECRSPLNSSSKVRRICGRQLSTTGQFEITYLS